MQNILGSLLRSSFYAPQYLSRDSMARYNSPFKPPHTHNIQFARPGYLVSGRLRVRAYLVMLP
jgi:hypothetical protein